jgi:AraC-like DNA-binding protein/mannose-6-phosphate isomerase-like protein (cupin superfamily)
MNHQELDHYLRKLDQIEEIQIKTGENVNDFDGNELVVESEGTIPRMQDFYFFDNGPVFINKHHRFANMPLHIHSFIELNYVYSGICHQQINGQSVLLEQGQICLLDQDVPHSISALGEQDILVNIIMKKETFSKIFLGRLSNNGIVADFLANAVSENQKHDKYLLFHSQHNENLQYIIKNIFCEFFSKQEHSLAMVNYYLPILFTELMRVYQLDKNFEFRKKTSRANIVDILSYIEHHYRDCTLTAIAKEFNFNPNYLGNMLKERTGKTFLELVHTQRMIHVSTMLQHTDKSIDEIAYEVGYESPSFLYRKFKKHFGQTPSHFRKNKK